MDKIFTNFCLSGLQETKALRGITGLQQVDHSGHVAVGMATQLATNRHGYQPGRKWQGMTSRVIVYGSLVN